MTMIAHMPAEAAWSRPKAVDRAARALASLLGLFKQAMHQRQLAELSDRQLCDAGVDLSIAGRGKAVAIDGPALRLQSLSFG